MPNHLVDTGTRVCEQCGAEYSRLPSRTISVFLVSRFCSHACMHLAREPISEKSCVACGQSFQRKKGRGGDHFATQRFCSYKCAARSRGNPRYRKIRVDGKQMQEHRYVMEQMIGRPLRPFESVHHKNGHRLDNQPENLELWATTQPYGQRVDDLIAFVVENYPAEVEARCQQWLSLHLPENLASKGQIA